MTDFTPVVAESEVDLAETLRMPLARNAAEVYEILDETDSVLITFNTSWWGNEAFGMWGDAFFVHVDGTSDGGALFVRDGVKANDPVRKLRAFESHMNSKGGVTSSGARREKRKAFDWFNTKKKPGPGMPSNDERDSFEDGSCPISVIEVAVRTPEDTDNLLFVPGEGATEGCLSDADVEVSEFHRTRYGPKFVFKGDTYEVFSSGGADVGDEVSWDAAHLMWDDDAEAWMCDRDAILMVAEAVMDAGFTLGVLPQVRDSVEGVLNAEEEADDVADSFGVDV